MRNFPRGTIVSPGSNPDGVTWSETTCGSSSSEVSAGLGTRLKVVRVESSRTDERMFSVRAISGTATANAAAIVRVVKRIFLFDMSVNPSSAS
jgi:hypothetical protein